MLAEQERIIQECGLGLREAREAAATSRAVSTRVRGDSRGAEAPAAPEDPAPGGVQVEALPEDPTQPREVDCNLMDENAARARPQWAVEGHAPPRKARDKPLERTFDLTLTLVGDFVDELARGYSQPWFQELVQECARHCGHRRKEFLMHLQDIAFEVQKPILENWGFDGDEQGVYDMTSILREHSQGAPSWLQERVDRCLALLYGGQMAGTLS